MNKGERSELIIKLVLIHIRDNNSSTGPISSISSVGLNGEYKSLPPNFNLNKLREYKNDQLFKLCNKIGVIKAPSRSKSDVYINGKGYSVKSLASAPPALVNHTTRPGFERICKLTGVDILHIDKLINNYWELRINKEISEDIHNKNDKSPFVGERKLLEPVLNYFLFEGTGKYKSNFPADYILDYRDPLDAMTWRVLDRNTALNNFWNKLIFSIRVKGMPKNFKNNESIVKWTREVNFKESGALHIRSGV
ncbi:hypothetical protein [Paenibacillus lignilyticus]|uniref:Uncharacterized protein n=1 Tax=Paenibacillus lignilyticus TaxID=1172615 RepID=A0ABS5CK96_9BACL|nr:hypothetical protein [Paenibacillus lignilyticus]MBP3966249.1 hypothetical protein [Paenibacillus lignilyticus]